MIGLTFVGDRCCDHSPSSGYDQLCSLFPDAGWLSGFELEAGRLTWHRTGLLTDVHATRIFHVIYGDCSGKSLPTLLRSRFPAAKIISSVHKPVAHMRADKAAWDAVTASDAIITVSEVQAGELEATGLDTPIYAIPHGVWTEVFQVPRARTKQPRRHVLLVGSFLRDWAGANQVVRRLARQGVRSIVLGASARDNVEVNHSCVEIPPRVPEARLASLYERAAAVFLPFLAATASNALLEAMAAGAPVICPHLPSLVDEYLGDDEDAFATGRYDVAAARLLHYVRNPADREAKRRQLMSRVARFDWSRLKQRFSAIYEALSVSTPA